MSAHTTAVVSWVIELGRGAGRVVIMISVVLDSQRLGQAALLDAGSRTAGQRHHQIVCGRGFGLPRTAAYIVEVGGCQPQVADAHLLRVAVSVNGNDASGPDAASSRSMFLSGASLERAYACRWDAGTVKRVRSSFSRGVPFGLPG